MAVNANTNKTYDVSTIREDLHSAMLSLTPTDTIFMSTIGSRNVDNTYYEWSEVDLASVDNSNRQLEADVLGNSAPTNAVRKGGYTQISAKVSETSSTANAVNGVASAQTIAKQVAYKLQELKRDMESLLLQNTSASAGTASAARATAGLPAYLTSNVNRGATGASGTTSGTGEAGFVNAAATDGTLRPMTEALLQDIVAKCWNAGATPTMVMCGSAQKQKISTFTGNATRFKAAEDAKLSAAIDVFISDFGEMQVVPNRLMRTRQVSSVDYTPDVFVLDPTHAEVVYLQTAKQEALAKTGLSERRLISCEYGLQVTSQKAHGIIADVNAA